MKVKKMRAIAVMMIVALFTAACSANGATTVPTKPADGTTTTVKPSTTQPLKPDTKGVVNLMSTIKGAPRPSDPEWPDEAYRRAVNRFSAELLLATLGNKGNLMVSPASVYLALAMTLNGADGETKAAMLDILADKGFTLEMINQASRDWMTLLQKTGSKTTLTIANSIWFDQAFIPYKPFLQDNADYFAADARKLDFKDPASIDTINRWVDEATKGTIDKILDEIRPDAVLFLINAIYFKSDWQVPFEKSETADRTFNTPGGEITTPFLHRTGLMDIINAPDATGVMLPYDDGRFGYFALLPDKNASPRDWLAKQDTATLFMNMSHWIDQRTEESMSLSMPKFESRFEDSLKDELIDIGLDIAFDPDKADLSRMNDSHEKDLYIGEVKHKTFIRVDEKGTEAAAVTSVEIRVTSMPVVEKELNFDRPFLYGIMDLETGMPLFVGIMENPAT